MLILAIILLVIGIFFFILAIINIFTSKAALFLKDKSKLEIFAIYLIIGWFLMIIAYAIAPAGDTNKIAIMLNLEPEKNEKYSKEKTIKNGPEKQRKFDSNTSAYVVVEKESKGKNKESARDGAQVVTAQIQKAMREIKTLYIALLDLRNTREFQEKGFEDGTSALVWKQKAESLQTKLSTETEIPAELKNILSNIIELSIDKNWKEAENDKTIEALENAIKQALHIKPEELPKIALPKKVDWYKGGTLQKSTVQEYLQGTPEDKIATASDWVSAAINYNEFTKLNMDMFKKGVFDVANCVSSNITTQNQMARDIAYKCMERLKGKYPWMLTKKQN